MGSPALQEQLYHLHPAPRGGWVKLELEFRLQLPLRSVRSCASITLTKEDLTEGILINIRTLEQTVKQVLRQVLLHIHC